MSQLQRAVFLDRDDTVIPNRHYLDNVEGVELLPGAGEGLRAMADMGYLLILITNQSGVGRGYFPESMVIRQYERLQELLQPFGVQFTAMKYCPHAPEDECSCRKPKPQMLLEAAKELGIDLGQSFMIGDKPADVGAGLNAGCQPIRIGSQNEDSYPVAPDLPAAAALIRDWKH